MINKHVEFSTTSYGNRVVKSIMGPVIGLILIIASLGVSYWNEDRKDLSELAKTAIPIDASIFNPEPGWQGKLVAASGAINSDQMISDNLYLKIDKYLAVKRRVEMYAWTEHKESQDEINNGSKNTRTAYNYTREWTEYPSSSSHFRFPEGHVNPEKVLNSVTNTATVATIGVYSFEPARIELPHFFSLPLNSRTTMSLPAGVELASDSYLYIKKGAQGTFLNPEVGDLRVSYFVLHPAFDGTIFGKLAGHKILPYVDQNEGRFYRLFSEAPEEAIVILHNEYLTMLWLLRFIGFMMMWVGLAVIFEPIAVLLDFVPAVGAASRVVIATVAFFVALCASTIVILISELIHNLIILIIVFVIALASSIAAFLKRLQRKKSSKQISIAG